MDAGGLGLRNQEGRHAMKQREIEAAFNRQIGQSESARAFVEKAEMELEWYAFDRKTGAKIEGTKAELLAWQRK